MDEGRIHRARSADGTEIAAEVHGQGPPLVFVHGGIGSGESWRFLLPFLGERFTCYPMSLRGRGLSAERPDQSVERLIEDVTGFADSIGEPVGIVGHSSGGRHRARRSSSGHPGLGCRAVRAGAARARRPDPRTLRGRVRADG